MKTPSHHAFAAANTLSPVIAGRALGRGGEGAVYTLADGQQFTLTREECEAVTPRWDLPETLEAKP